MSRSNPKVDENWRKNMPAVQKLIEDMAVSPTPRPSLPEEKKRWVETERADALGSATIRQLREHVCRVQNITMEELLEREEAVSHPREAIPCTQNVGISARARMLKAKVPEKYIRSVADRKPLECDPLIWVREFLNSQKGFLTLMGGKGTLKSGSASYALGQIDGGAFIEAQELISVSLAKDQARWNWCLNAPIVVVDDIGLEERKGGGLDAFMKAFYRLFNGVYTNCRRMIITGNMPKTKFALPPEEGGYGERTYDRLKEMGIWYNVAGESVRGTNFYPGSSHE